MSLLARLIEAGTPADLVAEVAEELARAKVSQEAIEQRRAKDRERQQRKRDAEAGNVMSRDIRDVTTDAPPTPSPKEINSNPHPHPPVKQTPARKTDDFPCPDWADPAVWRDLKRNRKTKNLTNTPTAHKRFVAAVEAMADDAWPPGRLLEEIVAKGWAGPHDPRDDRKPNNGRKPSNSGTNDNRDGAMRALDRRLGLDDVAGTSGRRNAGQSHRDSPLRIAAPSSG